MTNHDKIYIDGAWVASGGSGSIEVFDSTDGSVIGTIPSGNADDVDRAAQAARAAFDNWAATSPEERGKFCSRIAEGLGARMDEIATIVTREAGMPKWLSQIVQAGLPINSFNTAAALAESFAYETQVGNSLVVKEPVGVVGCITPWNYPLHQIAAKVAYAMAAGCTVVLKPSEVAPLDAYVLAEVIHDTGLPAGVFNLVTGTGAEVGEAIAAHPDIDMVSFTGSTRAGKRVAEVASQSLKRVALELGGKSANILLDDLDDEGFDKAVRDGVGKCYLNSGQTCTALTRMLVPRDRLADAERIAADEVANKFQPSDPFADFVMLGPLSSKAQVDRVNSYIQKGIDEGAKLVTGGTSKPEGVNPDGYFVQPTVFSEVTNDMTIAREEIFGPVLSILPYDTEEEAVEIANDTIYGLSGGVQGGDVERAKKVARRIRTGQIEVNQGAFNPNAPFGGYKQSGYGREYGEFGFDEFLEVKAMQL
ncbi:MAG: aldehyde dehydrogenase family protein [Actinomycetota bacterium]|nr:aldehyde dehydrogenase family protein [Acidimicrobiia bacterium]MDQ3294218.1 aldehyde dehydrogenase family protein [Actinomycetota bacterium]